MVFNVEGKVTAPAFQKFLQRIILHEIRNSSFGTEIQCHYQFKIKSCDIDGIWESRRQPPQRTHLARNLLGKNIKLSPKHIRVSIELSQTLIFQSSQSLGDLILNEIRAALAEELDRQIIHGDSSDDEISGIVNTSAISSDVIGTLTALTAKVAHGFVVGAEAQSWIE